MAAILATATATLDDVEKLLECGEVLAARRTLDAIAQGVAGNARQAHDVAQAYMRTNQPALAAGFYARAIDLDPAQPAYRYNQSTALIALGRLQDAEAALDSVIAVQSRDHDAWYNRATLRRQTPERNHVAAIEQALARPELSVAGSVPLYYALAKELEDLGEYECSFAALKRGANARRSMLSYRVDSDVAIMRDIAATFTRTRLQDGVTGCTDSRPIFVVGLPRSGTTLVDRILSSHSQIGSHGESADFALALVRLASPFRDKNELLQRSLQIDACKLGDAYGKRLAAHTEPRVVDKTPANFLYLGLVARALPNARIVYVRRRPMDVCYAMYKTLFRMAYPYSYDQRDLAGYWLAFDALMRHWQESLPAGRMLTLDYEQLVEAPEPAIQGLLTHVDVAWEDACLEFNRNPLPSLTASAAQVRQPIYTTSVGLWRRYAAGLSPLATALRSAGIDVETGTPT